MPAAPGSRHSRAGTPRSTPRSTPQTPRGPAQAQATVAVNGWRKEVEVTPGSTCTSSAAEGQAANGAHVRTAVRLRPLLPREAGQREGVRANVAERRVVVVDEDRGQERAFYADVVIDSRGGAVDGGAGAGAGQDAVFEAVGGELARHALDGYNACLLAYGHTGSGKTHTVLGEDFIGGGSGYSDSAPASPRRHGAAESEPAAAPEPPQATGPGAGLLPRVLAAIFAALAQEPGVSRTVSFYEIHNERIRDLLGEAGGARPVPLMGPQLWGAAEAPAPQEGGGGAIARSTSGNVSSAFGSGVLGSGVLGSGGYVHFHPRLGTFVSNVMEVPCESLDEALRLVLMGSRARTTASTALNDRSSRSHAVFTLRIERDGASNSLTLVDLAGREQQRLTQCRAERFKELTLINRSLFHLARCVRALTAQGGNGATFSAVTLGRDGGRDSGHHFRNSKLTMVLGHALAGNSHTCVIGTISPARGAYEDSLATLRFCESVKQVRTRPALPGAKREDMVIELQDEVRRLEAELLRARSGHALVERKLDEAQEMMEHYRNNWQQAKSQPGKRSASGSPTRDGRPPSTPRRDIVAREISLAEADAAGTSVGEVWLRSASYARSGEGTITTAPSSVPSEVSTPRVRGPPRDRLPAFVSDLLLPAAGSLALPPGGASTPVLAKPGRLDAVAAGADFAPAAAAAATSAQPEEELLQVVEHWLNAAERGPSAGRRSSLAATLRQLRSQLIDIQNAGAGSSLCGSTTLTQSLSRAASAVMSQTPPLPHQQPHQQQSTATLLPQWANLALLSQPTWTQPQPQMQPLLQHQVQLQPQVALQVQQFFQAGQVGASPMQFSPLPSPGSALLVPGPAGSYSVRQTPRTPQRGEAHVSPRRLRSGVAGNRTPRDGGTVTPVAGGLPPGWDLTASAPGLLGAGAVAGAGAGAGAAREVGSGGASPAAAGAGASDVELRLAASLVAVLKCAAAQAASASAGGEAAPEVLCQADIAALGALLREVLAGSSQGQRASSVPAAAAAPALPQRATQPPSSQAATQLLVQRASVQAESSPAAQLVATPRLSFVAGPTAPLGALPPALPTRGFAGGASAVAPWAPSASVVMRPGSACLAPAGATAVTAAMLLQAGLGSMRLAPPSRAASPLAAQRSLVAPHTGLASPGQPVSIGGSLVAMPMGVTSSEGPGQRTRLASPELSLSPRSPMLRTITCRSLSSAIPPPLPGAGLDGAQQSARAPPCPAASAWLPSRAASPRGAAPRPRPSAAGGAEGGQEAILRLPSAPPAASSAAAAAGASGDAQARFLGSSRAGTKSPVPRISQWQVLGGHSRGSSADCLPAGAAGGASLGARPASHVAVASPRPASPPPGGGSVLTERGGVSAAASPPPAGPPTVRPALLLLAPGAGLTAGGLATPWPAAGATPVGEVPSWLSPRGPRDTVRRASGARASGGSSSGGGHASLAAAAAAAALSARRRSSPRGSPMVLKRVSTALVQPAPVPSGSLMFARSERYLSPRTQRAPREAHHPRAEIERL